MHGYFHSTIRSMVVWAGPWLCQNHPLECGEVTGTIAQRRHRGDILDNGQRMYATDVEFTFQINVQANIAREGITFQYRRVQSKQR